MFKSEEFKIPSLGCTIQDLECLYYILALENNQGLTLSKVRKLDGVVEKLCLDQNRDKYFFKSRE